MTTSTAPLGRECDGLKLDPYGLRTHPECEAVLEPNFGFAEVSGPLPSARASGFARAPGIVVGKKTKQNKTEKKKTLNPMRRIVYGAVGTRGETCLGTCRRSRGQSGDGA